ncbi:MAG TPA: hypothetical protein VMG10_13100 [Gemmataceae bacterium]|nr:hypothetical protein [Gemmataceae bacterium]
MTMPQTSSGTANTESNGVAETFSPEVVAFAREYQAEHCLQPILEATHRIFPTASCIKVSVEEDPELRDNTEIVFEIHVAGLSRDQALAARRQWHEATLSVYRPLRKMLFCLYLKLKS